MALPELGNALQPVQQGEKPAKNSPSSRGKKFKLKVKEPTEDDGLVVEDESPAAEGEQSKDLTKKLLRFLGGKLPS